MNQQLVFTVLAEDKAGIVTTLADLVNQHGGNWLDSRMSQLAGEFAGIVHIALPVENRKAFESALNALPDLSITVKQTGDNSDSNKQINVEIFGNDRTGIVAEVTKLFSEKGINIVELDTQISEAPVSGGELFHADVVVGVSKGTNLEELQDKLHDLADKLSLDIEWTSRL